MLAPTLSDDALQSQGTHASNGPIARYPRSVSIALGSAILLAACGGPEPVERAFGIGSGVGAATASTGEGSSSTSTTTSAAPEGSTGTVPEDSSAGESGGSSGDGLLLDVGGGDLGPMVPAGCQGKIDFLFVMGRNPTELHAKLVEAFPAFVATIESKFTDFDFHILVVDGDEGWGAPACTADCPGLTCKVGEPCCPGSPYCIGDECVEAGDPCCVADYPCDLIDDLTKCDTVMGAGTLSNAGEGASNKACGVVGGHRYLTRDQPALAETFACLAQVGRSAGYKLGEEMVAAVSPALNRFGGCNEGFLRDDALLMVSFVYNVVDVDSTGKPKLWADALLEAKHGDPNAVVMFSLAFPGCPPQDRICDLVQHYFPYWSIANNEVDDYGAAFEQATDKLLDACAVYIPQ